MTDQETPSGPQRFEDQIREMMKKANLSFLMGDESPKDEKPSSAGRAAEPDGKEQRLKAIREFRLKPQEIKSYLDRFVIRQDEAKKVLSVAICDHYNHVRRCLEDPELERREYMKHNIMLLGPTGVGKTYLIRCVAKLIGVPFVKADATKFSETGYVGHDAEDMVRDLVKAADGDSDLARFGIIFVDEIDKIAAQTSGGGRDVSGRGVQVNLLKLMEETDASLFSQTDLIGQMQAVMEMQRGKGAASRTINTRHILMIVSGAFDKLDEQVRRRVHAGQIGFHRHGEGERTETDYFRLAQTRDFIEYGFEPEFVGRLPVRVVCDPLDANDLEAVLVRSEGSILRQYEEDFAGYGIEARMAPEAIRAVARMAEKEKTGARGLATVLERVFRNYKFELPSSGVQCFDVDEEAVRHAGSVIERLRLAGRSDRAKRAREGLRTAADRFREAHGFRLVFGRPATDRLVELCLESDRSAEDVFSERFRDVEYGLRLIADNTGQRVFRITKKMAERPQEELSKMISASYGKKRGRIKNRER